MRRTLTMAAVAGVSSAILVPLALVLWIRATVPGATAASVGIPAALPVEAGLAGAAMVLLVRLLRSRRASS